jgi:hypothetical protein
MAMKALGMNTLSRIRIGILPSRGGWPAGSIARCGVAGWALVALFAACGGSSKPGDARTTAGSAPEVAGSRAAGGKAVGSGGGGGGTMTEAGQSGDATTIGPHAGAGSGGDGGAPPAALEPTLGSTCDAPGALACAGPHQKLTLVCSAGRKWETNQTCPSGQFCSSTPGPDLGICKDPTADCASHQPGDSFCAADAKTLMRCDRDGIAAEQVEQCGTGCVDGRCAAAHPCPESLIYSCDPGCPGPNTAPSCFNLCPSPAGGMSPLLELPAVPNGVKYVVALPAVATSSQPCSCAQANGALQAVAFRVPNASNGSRWRFSYPKAWEFHDDANPYEEPSDYYKGCNQTWPRHLSGTPGCALVIPSTTAPLIWLSATGPIADPGTLIVELLPNADATCAP